MWVRVLVTVSVFGWMTWVTHWALGEQAKVTVKIDRQLANSERGMQALLEIQRGMGRTLDTLESIRSRQFGEVNRHLESQDRDSAEIRANQRYFREVIFPKIMEGMRK